MDIKLILLVEIVANVLNLVLVYIQPIEGWRKQKVIKLLYLVVGDIQPSQSGKIIEETNNIRYLVCI